MDICLPNSAVCRRLFRGSWEIQSRLDLCINAVGMFTDRVQCNGRFNILILIQSFAEKADNCKSPFAFL